MRIILLVAGLSIYASVTGQTIRSQVDAYFAEVNRGALSTGYVLNKGLFTLDQLAMFDTMTWRGNNSIQQQ